MLTRIVTKFKSDGLFKTMILIKKRLIRIRKHYVYIARCTDVNPPSWLPEEQVYRASCKQPWDEVLSKQITDLSPDNQDYLDAVLCGEAEVLAIVYHGRVVHYAFLMYGNKTTCLLGFNKQVGLIGNVLTINSYRGRNCQARSSEELARMAGITGLEQVISETAYDNTASQRGLAKSQLKLLGKIEILILFNTLVIRYRRPTSSIRLIGFCW